MNATIDDELKHVLLHPIERRPSSTAMYVLFAMVLITTAAGVSSTFFVSYQIANNTERAQQLSDEVDHLHEQVKNNQENIEHNRVTMEAVQIIARSIESAPKQVIDAIQQYEAKRHVPE